MQNIANKILAPIGSWNKKGRPASVVCSTSRSIQSCEFNIRKSLMLPGIYSREKNLNQRIWKSLGSN